jgi:hypothetical protein
MMKCITFYSNDTEQLDELINAWFARHPDRKPIKSHFAVCTMELERSGNKRLVFTTQIFHIYNQDSTDEPAAKAKGEHQGVKP